MVNQICIAGCVQGLSEAIAFGMNAGLDMPKVIEALSSGAASSWQMVNRGRTMVKGEFDFGFAVDWMRKDLGIVKDEAAATARRFPSRGWSTASTKRCRRRVVPAGILQA